MCVDFSTPVEDRWDGVPYCYLQRDDALRKGVSLNDAVVQLGFPAGLKDDLQHQWALSVEEFLSILGELRRMELPPRSILRLEEALTQMDNSPKRKKTIPDEKWEKNKNRWMGGGFVQRKGFYEGSCGGFKSNGVDDRAKLRPGFFIPKIYPVHNQGEEGACVAFAVCALIEYLLDRPIPDELILGFYEECLKVDGVHDCGTLFSAAIPTARKLGLWPEEASECLLNPRDISSLKETLQGSATLEPSPIVATLRTFRRREKPSDDDERVPINALDISGKWILPFGDQRSEGLHAVTFWGYRDADSVPGGGYFIAKNSWGEEYACLSPHKLPGYSLIPYEYVQRFCEDAYAAEQRIAPPPPPPPFQNPYFPVPADAELISQAAGLEDAGIEFMNGTAANIQGVDDRDSTLTQGFFKTPKFKVGESIDLSRGVREAMAKKNGLPIEDWPLESAPQEYKKAIAASASVKLWFVGDGKRSVAIVAAFIAPLEFKENASPTFVEPTKSVVQAVAEKIAGQIAGTGRKPDRIVLALGTPSGDLGEIAKLAKPLKLDIVSYSVSRRHSRIDGRYWETTLVGATDAWSGPFRAAARPTTPESLLEKIRAIADDRGYQGDLSVEYAAGKLDQCASDDEIQEAYDFLVENEKNKYAWDPLAANGKGALLRLR